jgi:hypothetical protein
MLISQKAACSQWLNSRELLAKQRQIDSKEAESNLLSMDWLEDPISPSEGVGDTIGLLNLGSHDGKKLIMDGWCNDVDEIRGRETYAKCNKLNLDVKSMNKTDYQFFVEKNERALEKSKRSNAKEGIILRDKFSSATFSKFKVNSATTSNKIMRKTLPNEANAWAIKYFNPRLVRKLDANNPENWKVINQQELLMIEAKAKAPPDKSMQAVKENLQINTSGNIFKDATAGHSGQRRPNKLTKVAEPNFQQMKDPCLSVNFISESQLFRTPGGYSMKDNFPSTKFSPS